MKLKQIKLAGFKSFVDSTKIPFEKALTGIVGPNGCGKSNVIDAVRWVLGESSAKHLRGGAMTDVIFSGSNARKPVSVASVELSFDNQDGRLAGQYSSYQEISVKRQVSRDGDSFYFLNGQKCRRKDITDLFMGTGLGPRSYAIIEQGMISRLIESKPQDLRVFIEEAAGISRYKERRRDTENRIRHTRENLERLFDIRNELETQLKKLESQSKSALKYREQKKIERRLHAELLVLKYQEHTTQVDQTTVKINRLDVELEKINAEIESVKGQHTKLSLELSELNAKEQNQVEAFYKTGTEIARLEQQSTHQKQLDKKLLEQLEKDEQQKLELESDLKVQQEKSTQLRSELINSQNELEVIQEQVEESKLSLEDVQSEYTLLSDTERTQRQQLSEFKLQLQLHQSQQTHKQQNVSHLEQQLQQLNQQQDSLAQEQVDVDKKQNELHSAHQKIIQLEQKQDKAKRNFIELEQQVLSITAEQKTVETAITEKSSRINIIEEWLSDHQQSESPIWQVINVNKGWEKPVELLLGNILNHAYFDTTSAEEIGFVHQKTEFKNAVITSSKVNLAPWFNNVEFIETKTQALAAVKSNIQMMYLTQDGYIVGDGFILEKQNTESSQLSLQSEKLELSAQLTDSKALILRINQRLADSLERKNEVNDELLNLNQELQQIELKRSSLLSSITVISEQQQKDNLRKQEIAQRIDQIQKQIVELQLTDEVEQEKQQRIEVSIEDVASLLIATEQTMKQKQSQVQQVKATLNELQQKLNTGGTHNQKINTQLAVCEQQIIQTKNRIDEFNSKVQELQNSLDSKDAEIGVLSPRALEQELKKQVQLHSEQQSELTVIRQLQTHIQAQVNDFTHQQKQFVSQQESIVKQIGELKISREGIKGQINSQLELLKEEKVDIHSVAVEMPPNADINNWHEELEKVKQRIARLGAINLTAIEEFEQQKERKDYLDKQNDDLTSALDSLESAIRKIDRETRSRFKETYEKVNNDLQVLFPKVFGGGSAYLELTGDDLLETGITIMARPPGKKNSTIHLLSGGEKALTALSLVFAIFRLNPAPFCMLDEVDAPLDDANVERFCRLLEEMSQTVQFIYISHNKITMEMADQLIGVTMHEPGVSRIVAVDVDEAVALADVG
ncbi:chromosome segregation protein SMC [Shewanella sp. 202IG2-18]|uniref:chromosome segregation protein SMC n=1 Tax=Parashewanella hymeniacidonis TaxID=2807618 RepID=UPI001960C25B|nr:chromosome segregation protein SMC [Parashewanella hymeniacidonis]MBM7072386.1 chromosome segregation protein SMC [Parashewanella hymeniacidonis]